MSSLNNLNQNNTTKLAEVLQEAMRPYFFDPVGLCKKIWGHVRFKGKPFFLDKWQEEAFENFLRHSAVVISSGTGVGKTAWFSLLIWYYLLCRPYTRVIIVTESKQHSQQTLWSEITKWYERSELLQKLFIVTDTKIWLKGCKHTWWAGFATAPKQKADVESKEGMQGYHEEFILFVGDEATGLSHQTFSAIEGGLTTGSGAKAVYAANPIKSSGRFIEIITKEDLWIENGGKYKVMFVSAEDSSFVDKVMIKKQEKQFGRDSNFFRAKILGLPPTQSSTAILSQKQIYAMHFENKPEPNFEKNGLVMGFDPGRSNDPAVSYIRKGYRLIRRKKHASNERADVVKELVADARIHNVRLLHVDEIGIGWDLDKDIETCARAQNYKLKVVPVHVGKSPIGPKAHLFVNIRSQFYWLLRFFAHKIVIPFETALLDEELTRVEFKYTNYDKVSLPSKKEIKLLLNRSPNDSDALILCFYNVLHRFALHGLATLTDVDFMLLGQYGFRAVQASTSTELSRTNSIKDEPVEQSEVVSALSLKVPNIVYKNNPKDVESFDLPFLVGGSNNKRSFDFRTMRDPSASTKRAFSDDLPF